MSETIKLENGTEVELFENMSELIDDYYYFEYNDQPASERDCIMKSQCIGIGTVLRIDANTVIEENVPEEWEGCGIFPESDDVPMELEHNGNKYRLVFLPAAYTTMNNPVYVNTERETFWLRYDKDEDGEYQCTGELYATGDDAEKGDQ